MTLGVLLTSLVVVATPGTGVVLTVTAGVSKGRRASVVTAIGCTLGIVPHLLAAVTGTAALLRASGEAFNAVKIAGVVYLGYMAVMTWRDRRPVIEGGPTPWSVRRTITSAILANLLNPKLTLFFFTFLPLFVPTRSPHATLQLVVLSAIFMAMTLVVFVAYGLLAAAGRQAILGRPQVLRRLRQVFALTFVGLGARLAVARR